MGFLAFLTSRVKDYRARDHDPDARRYGEKIASAPTLPGSAACKSTGGSGRAEAEQPPEPQAATGRLPDLQQFVGARKRGALTIPVSHRRGFARDEKQRERGPVFQQVETRINLR